MQTRRFDALTRRLATRSSRRALFGVGAAALGSAGASPHSALAQVEVAEDTTAIDRYIAVRTYAYDSSREKAEAELPDLIAHMEEQPGFVGISCVWGDGEIYLVTTFLDETTAVPGLETIDWWIETHIQSTLYGDYEQSEGNVFLRSMLTAGCPCDLEDEDDPCGSDVLVCCPTSDVEGDPGVCLTARTTCPAVGGEDATSEDEDDITLSAADVTPTATTTSSSSSTCTSEGCACPDGICDSGLACCTSTGTCEFFCPCGYEGCHCVGSEFNTCNDGLVCCAPGEIGGDGTCQYACSCTSEGCACTTGVDGACDAGLTCCGIFSSDPGHIGACLSTCSGSSNPCPGAEGCECILGTNWICNDGLACCGAIEMGDSGICQSACSSSEPAETTEPEVTSE